MSSTLVVLNRHSADLLFTGPQNNLDFPSSNWKWLAFMLISVKSWSITCALRLNRLDTSVSCILYFVPTPFGVSQVVCGAPISACLHCGPRGCFRSEWCTDGESVAAPGDCAWTISLHWVWGRTSRKHHFSSLRCTRQGIEISQPALVARALPTAPPFRFRLNIMTQNKILVLFHSYCVLEKVQWRPVVQEVWRHGGASAPQKFDLLKIREKCLKIRENPWNSVQNLWKSG